MTKSEEIEKYATGNFSMDGFKELYKAENAKMKLKRLIDRRPPDGIYIGSKISLWATIVIKIKRHLFILKKFIKNENIKTKNIRKHIT